MRQKNVYRGKRLFDILFSLVVMVVFSWFFFLVLLLILMFSGWRVFFLQTRIGLNGKKFKVIKFRTMVKNAEQQNEKIKAKHHIETCFFSLPGDTRITKIGKVIRFFELDELPQFALVLWGQMSIIGPRPQSVKLLGQFTFERIEVKPGLFDQHKLEEKILRFNSTVASVESVEDWVQSGKIYLQKASLYYDILMIIKCLVYFTKKILSLFKNNKNSVAGNISLAKKIN